MNKHKFYGAFLAFATVASVSMGAMANNTLSTGGMNSCPATGQTTTTTSFKCQPFGYESYAEFVTCTAGGFLDVQRLYCAGNATEMPNWLKTKCLECRPLANHTNSPVVLISIAEPVSIMDPTTSNSSPIAIPLAIEAAF